MFIIYEKISWTALTNNRHYFFLSLNLFKRRNAKQFCTEVRITIIMRRPLLKLLQKIDFDYFLFYLLRPRKK